ncbi:MAG: type IV secretory system conjugative DNA transfer family protein [Rhizobiaceae bacterium]
MGPVSIVIALIKLIAWAYTTAFQCLWGSVAFLASVRKWRDRDLPTHGNASFAQLKELRRRGYLRPEGFLMCVMRRGRWRKPVKVFNRAERSVLFMAPPGAGKSQQLIADLKAVLTRPEHRLPFLVIGDAGDELFTRLGADFRRAGYSIAKIDATQPEDWTKYDILSGLTPQKRFLFNTQVKAICEAIVPDEPHSKHPHFVEFARLLLKCIISVDVQFEGNRRTIGQMVDLLLDDDEREAMLKRAALYDDAHIRKTLQVMQKMQDKNEGVSMMSTALRKLEPWGDPAVREVTTFGNDLQGGYSRGWTFTQMFTQDRPVVLFIRTGYQDIGGALARIVFSNAVNEVSAMWDETSKPLRRELLLYLDEAGLSGHVSAFVKAFSRLRKVGVRLRMCFVSLDEFKKCYPDDHKTFLNGCDLLVPGGGNDIDMYAYAEKLAGEFTVQSRSENESDHGQSKGRSEQARKLVKQDEFRREERTTIFAFMDNQVVKGNPPWSAGKRGVTYL